MTNASQLTPLELEQALATVKKNAHQLKTNFFVPINRWKEYFYDGIILLKQSNSLLAFARIEQACLRYFFVCDQVGFSELGKSVSPLPDKPLVIDLLGRHQEVALQAESLTQNGFNQHEIILRLVRTSRPEENLASSTIIDDARTEDIPEIIELLTTEFDPLADQLPNQAEIIEAVTMGNVRVARKESVPIAFIWSDRVGVTATIRYWGVKNQNRGTGVGGALMHDFFRAAQNVPRQLIWVRSQNKVARSCYEHYGYTPDGLEDFVMIKKG